MYPVYTRMHPRHVGGEHQAMKIIRKRYPLWANMRINWERDTQGYIVVTSTEPVHPKAGYSRAADGVLRDAWGYPVNYITIRNGEVVGCGFQFGQPRPMFFLWFVHKQRRINRQTYRAGFTRKGEPRKVKA